MFNFSEALTLLTKGYNVKVQRQGWNGKGMFLTYFSPARDLPEAASEFAVGDEGFPLLPFIMMKTADNKFVPWLASQTDILANDWQVYRPIIGEATGSDNIAIGTEIPPQVQQ
jgi:hypothetical protein